MAWPIMVRAVGCCWPELRISHTSNYYKKMMQHAQYTAMHALEVTSEESPGISGPNTAGAAWNATGRQGS